MKKFYLLSLIAIFFAAELQAAPPPIKGSVTNAEDGSPVEGVLITDGYVFTKTDARGAFAFEASDLARFIYMVTPSGWIAPYEDGFPHFYLPVDARAKRYDFTLKPWTASVDGYDMLAIADPQPKTDEHFARLQNEIMPPLKRDIAANENVQVAIILGDIVWDSPELFEPVKKEFGQLGIPVYPVIGNHDHDLNCYTDREATVNYCNMFGPTYYAFDIANTHYIVLDDIYYYGAKRYIEDIDDTQCAWLRNYFEYLPAGSRVCIAMHAPVWKSWRENEGMPSALKIIKDLKDYDLHFLTGHTHVNSNFDVGGHALEHNVAQINGNLWRDEMNYDGTPKGYLRLHEQGDTYIWDYRTLEFPEDYHIRVWNRGEVKNHMNQVVAKIWEWDSHWTVVWYEDGEYRGAMQRVMKMPDPDYERLLEGYKAAGKSTVAMQRPQPVNFYFTATPSKKASKVTIEATDRFGRKYVETVQLAE